MRLGPRQIKTLKHIADNPNQRVTAHVFNELCGTPDAVRSMFRKSLVAGDAIPATWITLTDAGRAALSAARQPEGGGA
jgi:hypothetical protein